MRWVIKCDNLGTNKVTRMCYFSSVSGRMIMISDCVTCFQACKKITLE